MELSGILAAARRWVWTLVVAAILAGVTAYLVGSAVPPTYESSVRLLVGPLSASSTTLRAASQLTATYGELVDSGPVLEATRNELSLSAPISQLSDAVQTTANTSTRLLTIRVQDGDPERAAALANALADHLARLPLQGDIAVRPEGQISIVDAAVPNENPVAPQLRRIVPLAATAGLLGAFGLVLLVEYFSEAVRNEGELGELAEIPVLGTVVRTRASRHDGSGRPVVEASPDSPDAASYLMLASKVEAALVGQSLRSVAVVGAGAASGASEVAVNLASALALPGRPVMVVDADPETRGVSGALGLEGRPGLTELLGVLDRSGFADRLNTVLVRRWRHLVALGVGSSPLSSADPEHLTRLLQHLLVQSEVVVVSTLPVHQGPMGMQWVAATQATIVVVEPDATTREDYREVVQSLRMADAHVVGAVLHRVSYRGRPRRPQSAAVPPPPTGDPTQRDALTRGVTPQREPAP